MRLFAVAGLGAVLSLSFCAGVCAQAVLGGGPALSVVPVIGRIEERSHGERKEMSGIYLFDQDVVVARWQVNVDLTLPVLGMELRGPAAITMEEHHKSLPLGLLVGLFESYASGEAKNVVLHGPAGDATISLALTPVWDEFKSIHVPVIQIRGTGGTGAFDGIRIAGDFKPVPIRGHEGWSMELGGTLYLGYSSQLAALNAIQRGLSQNVSLNDAKRAEVLAQAKQIIPQAQVANFPSEAELAAASQPKRAGAPTKADVTQTTQRSGARAQVMLQIVVPTGDPHQAVTVIVAGSDSSPETVYERMLGPGERAYAQANGTPPFYVLIYVAGNMIKYFHVPAQED